MSHAYLLPLVFGGQFGSRNIYTIFIKLWRLLLAKFWMAGWRWRIVMDYYSRMHICVTETLLVVGNTVPTYWVLFSESINRQKKKTEMKGTYGLSPFRKGICIVSVNPLLALLCFFWHADQAERREQLPDDDTGPSFGASIGRAGRPAGKIISPWRDGGVARAWPRHRPDMSGRAVGTVGRASSPDSRFQMPHETLSSCFNSIPLISFLAHMHHVQVGV